MSDEDSPADSQIRELAILSWRADGATDLNSTLTKQSVAAWDSPKTISVRSVAVSCPILTIPTTVYRLARS